MALYGHTQLAPVTARDGVDARNPDNSATAAAGAGETTSVGVAHVRGGQLAARKIKDVESMYEELEDVDREVYEHALEDLVEVGMLVKEMDDDEDRTYYRSRDGLGWAEVVRLDCPIKKQILLTLINNPQTFFVLYNTQKGKLRIAAEEMRDWAAFADKKVVAFLIVDNDKTLADQSADGVITIIAGVAKVFLLSSNSSDTTLEVIRTHIDAYAADKDGEYLMPVIVALNNATQMKKVIALMNHIKIKVEQRASLLRYGVVFDEADKVYPPLREKFAPLLVDDTRALYRLGFVTATEGDLMDADYPECANAYMYPVPVGHPDYRAIHTEDADVKVVVHRVKDSNDVYAETIIANNNGHFTTRVLLKDGSLGFRKTIVNGGAKTASMEAFALNRVAAGHYAITVNMLGVWVYRPGHEKKRYSTKGKKFGQLLFTVYNELGLHDKPLFIIGRRKVDRGLGFHWAPRDGSAGLIWTDMILGRVDDKDTAVQKAGRLAGVVAQCPQCPAKLTWWTDEKTKRSVTHHNTVVDEANVKRGCSALQAMTRAEAAVPEAPMAPLSEFGPQVPEIVEMSAEEFATIPTGRDPEGKQRAVLAILATHHEALAARLEDYDCKEITAPNETGSTSYKNHIQVAVRNWQSRQPCSVTLSKEERKRGGIWNCFIDKHTTPKRLCFVYVNPPSPPAV